MVPVGVGLIKIAGKFLEAVDGVNPHARLGQVQVLQQVLGQAGFLSGFKVQIGVLFNIVGVKPQARVAGKGLVQGLALGLQLRLD